MNYQQEKRYNKLRTDQFYLLGNEKVDDKFKYHISGSTKNVYTVTVHPERSTIFCTCPDAKSWAAKYKCVCKHVLFVLYRVLKVFDIKDHPFFDRLWFTPEELECIQLSTEYLQGHLDNTIINSELTKKYQALQNGIEEKNNYIPTGRFDVDDVCGVCFLDLEEEDVEYCMACPKCNKAAHTDCIKKWISSGQKLCVYCRQNVWGEMKNSSGAYKNLS